MFVQMTLMFVADVMPFIMSLTFLLKPVEYNCDQEWPIAKSPFKARSDLRNSLRKTQ